MKWLIWSFEHRAWWGPNRRGYVQTVDQAGRYSAVEACEILEDCMPGNEMPVSVRRAQDGVWPAKESGR